MYGEGASGVTVPSTLKSVYGLTNNVVTNAGATQSLFEALGQNYSPADLKQFQNQQSLEVQAIAKTIGPNDPSSVRMLYLSNTYL